MKISVNNLNKSYVDGNRKLTIIQSLSREFSQGSSVAIVGKSGVGKSTLLHLLGGLDRPTGGNVLFDETDIVTVSNDDLASFRGRNVGFIFQFHHLLPEFSAVENVAMPLQIQGVEELEARDRAQEVLKIVGLEQRLDHRPGELSGGEQQRVAIARAIVAKPNVILADEPTGNLDYENAAAIQKLLVDLNRDMHNILIIVTHNMDLAKSMGIVLEMYPGGELRECG